MSGGETIAGAGSRSLAERFSLVASVLTGGQKLITVDQEILTVQEATTRLRESVQAACIAEERLIAILRQEGLPR
ncbi:MAG: hypothetical protein ACOX3S_15135 [Anaerolineae bacterium]|jgi:hypothetical protein